MDTPLRIIQSQPKLQPDLGAAFEFTQVPKMLNRNEKNANGPSTTLGGDPPLLVSPRLATILGLNEALVLMQVHYWLSKRLNFERGHYWVYNSYPEWQGQFPFFSESTIKRAFQSLERPVHQPDGNRVARGPLLVSSKLRAARHDQRKWYRIDYAELDRVVRQAMRDEAQPVTEDLSFGSDWTDQDGPNLTSSYTETTQIELTETNAHQRSFRNERQQSAHDLQASELDTNAAPQRSARGRSVARKATRTQIPVGKELHGLCYEWERCYQRQLSDQGQTTPLSSDVLTALRPKWAQVLDQLRQQGTDPYRIKGALNRARSLDYPLERPWAFLKMFKKLCDPESNMAPWGMKDYLQSDAYKERQAERKRREVQKQTDMDEALNRMREDEVRIFGCEFDDLFK